MHPGEVTTVVMRFDLPVVPFVVPSSPRTGGQNRLALPHPGARGARHDATAHRGVTRGQACAFRISCYNVATIEYGFC